MPTLDFKGKPFVYSHHLSVPFRELVVDAKKSLVPKGEEPSLDDNLIIHGDNLEALKALLPRYAGKVDVIYIDPPYNTGKEGWAYNDKVNSPLMKEWLGKVVGEDDLERHDKWLCMMWPRLQLLRELLSPKGLLFVSCDDNEASHARMIFDESFQPQNWLGTIVWKNATDNNPTRIAVEHEYIHCYCKSKEEQKASWSGTENSAKSFMLDEYNRIKGKARKLTDIEAEFAQFVRANRASLGDLARYKEVDANGPYVARRNLENPGKKGYSYDVIHPKTKKPCTKPLWGWRYPEARMKDLIAQGRIIFGDTEEKIPEIKAYLSEVSFPLRSVINMDGRKGSNELEGLFGTRDKFKNPKPAELIEYLLEFVAGPDAIVLDSFAGSGTTAHAVQMLNSADKGKRKFILIECEDYASTTTVERVRLVMRGVKGATDEPLKIGLGGTFAFCTLGDPIDLERFFDGASAPEWEQVARYVAYTATGQTLSKAPKKPGKDWFVGEAGGYRIHLIYEPDVEFMRSNKAALDMALAERIFKCAEGKPVLVYAAAKFMGQKDLLSLGITFCQLPYAIHRILGDGPNEA